jgi:hypothetical protein
MSTMRHRLGRSTIAISSAALLGLTFLGGTASAHAHGTKGDPQPELKPFTIAAKDADGGGSVAILPNGTVLTAFNIPTSNGDGAMKVCLLARTAHACSSSSPTVTPPPGATISTDMVPQIFAVSATTVVLLADETVVGKEVYTSTNGGKSFGTPVSLGTSEPGVDEAALAGGSIVYGQDSGTSGGVGPSIGSFTATAPAPGPVAAIGSQEAQDVGIASYKGGVLVANQQLSNGDVVISYAKAGNDFSSAASYQTVGTIKNEDFEGISGGALLTEVRTGKFPVHLRIFNGTSFGAAHTVPHAEAPGPETYILDQDSRGITHVFTVLAGDGYALEEESSSTGATWTGRQALTTDTPSSTWDIALDATGSGIILGTTPGIQSKPIVTAYPVLAQQSLSFALNHRSATRKHHVKASGRVSPKSKGRTVTLQEQKKGLWYVVATTKETASGKFHFTLKDATAGKFTYRAVAADAAGYVQFGYSSARKLTVTTPKRR